MTRTSTENAVLTLDGDGQPVRVFTSGPDRLWRCECEYFQRMLAKHSEGFCPHVAVAIGRAIEDGVIDIGGL